MAAIQGRYKWIKVFLPVIANFLVQIVSGCHPSSKQLHICLNIYLERDFPLIETIVKGQAEKNYRTGRVILEGPDLSNICKDVSSLKECYSDLLRECNTLWQFDRYMRVMNVLGATHDYLCMNGTDNIRDLLLNSGCLALARSHIADCTGFDWSMSWREVLRMQVSPQDRCGQLEAYGNCLKTRLRNVVCGTEAARTYEKLIDVWLRHWCAKDFTTDDERRYFYMTLRKT